MRVRWRQANSVANQASDRMLRANLPLIRPSSHLPPLAREKGLSLCVAPSLMREQGHRLVGKGLLRNAGFGHTNGLCQAQCESGVFKDKPMESPVSYRHSALLILIALIPARSFAATLVVDNTSDNTLSACTAAANDCSLRGAITAANALSDFDDVTFDIPNTDPGFQPTTNHWRILVGATALPGFTNPMTIDGFTQPGAAPNTQTPDDGGLNSQLRIEIQPETIAANQQVGFDVGLFNFSMPSSSLRGLAISGFRTQIQLAGGSAHVVEGCYLGTDITGTSATIGSPTTPSTGIRIQGPGAFRIGGIDPEQRNLIAGMQSGISWFSGSSGVVIQGNLIGTNAAGSEALRIHNDALSSSAPVANALIGGDTSAARNIISGTSFSAIRLFISAPADVTGTRIQGNWLGTDVTGTRPIGNGTNPQSPSQPFATMTISGSNVCNLAIGGLGPGEANRIAFGGNAGILNDRCNGITTPLNEFIGNRGIPFDNVFGGGAVGATPNDLNDADDFAGNRLQNFPEITLPQDFAPTGSDTVMLQYRVDTALANASYPLTVNFYRAACGGGSRELLASDTYNNGDAQQLRNFTLTAADGGNVLPLVATAVDSAGNTSEFTAAVGEALFVDGFEDEPASFSTGQCQ